MKPGTTLQLFSLLAILVGMCEANVSPMDATSTKLIIQQKTPALFLFTSSSSPNSQSGLQHFHEAASRYHAGREAAGKGGSPSEDLLFVVSDPNDGLFTFDKIAEYLGVREVELPALVFLGRDNRRYKMAGSSELTPEALLQFVGKSQRGEIEEYFKSESQQSLDSEARTLKSITAKGFRDEVLNSSKQYMIIFHSPWDYKSRGLKLQVQHAAHSLQPVNSNIIFYKINGLRNELAALYKSPEAPSLRLSFKDLPRVMFWRRDKKLPPIEFKALQEYEKSFDHILEWLKTRSEYEWVQPEELKHYLSEQF